MIPSRLDAQVDVVDSADRVVGTLRRKALLPSGANFRVVHTLLFNRSGEILLQCIAPNLRHAGMWGSSVAGYVQAGESYDVAAARKLQDELRLQITLKSVGNTSMRDGLSLKFIGIYQAVYDGPLTPDSTQVAQLVYLPLQTVWLERQAGTRAFTPTFLHVLDHYLATTAKP